MTHYISISFPEQGLDLRGSQQSLYHILTTQQTHRYQHKHATLGELLTLISFLYPKQTR